MTPDEKKRFDALDPAHQSVIVVLQALLNHHTPEGEARQSLNPRLAVEACLIAAAALIENDPGAETKRGLREVTDRAGEQLKVAAKSFRATYETGGLRGLQQIGAIDMRNEAVN